MPEETEATARLEALTAELKKGITPGMDEEVQEELGKLIGLLPYLRASEYSHHIGGAEIAATALLSEQPNLKLAKRILERLSYRIRPAKNPLIAVLRSGTPPTRVIFGLGLLLYFAIPLLFWSLPKLLNQQAILGIETNYLLMVAFAGAIGSIVSIMVRIQDFSGLRDVDPSVLFFTGFFKPVVGAAFALFVFAVLRSGLIPVTIEQGTDRYFFLALSFVAGFSERFAKDIVKTTEYQIGGSSTEDKN
jgi:hypothetical protein